MFDLNAAIQEKASEPFRFHFGDGDYVLPPTPDLRAIVLLTEGQLAPALRVLLGPDQWAQLEGEAATFGLEAFTALINAYMAHAGTTLPESRASTDS